jgi:hypothetical protein
MLARPASGAAVKKTAAKNKKATQEAKPVANDSASLIAAFESFVKTFPRT